MRVKEEYDYTSNSSVYNKLHKLIWAHCDRCRWNRGENQSDYIRKSWKIYRKKQHKATKVTR